MRALVVLLFCLSGFVFPGTPILAQQQWDRFHGPNGSGVSLDSKLPPVWSDDNVQWKKSFEGIGSSSPVIWNDRLFITFCQPKTGKLTLECLDAKTGKSNWKQEFQLQPHPLHDRNNLASATQAVDADHVYVSYADPDHTMLVALTHAGEKVWERDFGTWVSQHGFGVSPMVFRDLVIFFNSQDAEQLPPGAVAGPSEVIAVNRRNGEDVWKTPLAVTRTCYAMLSQFPASEDSSSAENDSAPVQLIGCNTNDGFFSLDPATGKLNWTVAAFSQRTVASTLVADGMVIGSCGSGGGGNVLVAIRPGLDPALPPAKEAYTVQRSNYVPSPVAVGGLLFFFNDKGIGSCIDLQTGKPNWQERIAAGFSGSPVATKDHIYIADENGTLYVVAASSKFQILSHYDLGEPSRATPAIVGDRLYLRTDSQLFCLQDSTK